MRTRAIILHRTCRVISWNLVGHIEIEKSDQLKIIQVVNRGSWLGPPIFKWVAETWLYDVIIKRKHFPRYWPFVRGNPPVTDRFPSQRPMTRSFDVFIDLCLNKRLSKHSRRGDLRHHLAHNDVTVMYMAGYQDISLSSLGCASVVVTFWSLWCSQPWSQTRYQFLQPYTHRVD